MKSANRPLHLVQFTDTHLLSSSDGKLCGLNTRLSFAEVLKQIKRRRPRPDFYLATGDISQDGSRASYQRFRQIVTELERPVSALPGNHDRVSMMKSVMKRSIIQTRGEIQTPTWDMILLNSTRPPHPGGWLRPSELRRLKRFLDRRKTRSIMIVLHHNPIPLGSRWLDRMTVKNKAAFNRILQGHSNVKMVLFGHVHQSFQKIIQGRMYVSTPSTCIQFVPRSRTMGLDRRWPGFRWLDLYPNGKIRTGVIRLKSSRLKPDYSIKRY